MKYIKMLGLAAVAAAALMAFLGASTASATQLTDGAGNILGVGTVIKAEAEEPVVLHPPIGEIECTESKVEGEVDNAGSSTATVFGGIDLLTFAKCNTEEIVVLQNGSLEIHTGANANDGTLTGKGNRVTVKFVGFHCIFETNATNGTDLGTVTGSTTTGGNATLDIEAVIPRVGGSSGIFCGGSAQWTGAYKVTSPSPLNIH